MTTERTSSDAVTQEPQQQESDLLTDTTTEEQLNTEVEQGLSEGAKENVESGEPEASNQGAGTTEVSNNDSTQQPQEIRTYSHDEVSKMQSSYDKRASENDKQVSQLQEQVNNLQQQSTTQNQQYSEQQIVSARDTFIRDKTQWLVQQGVDESQAVTQARQEGESAAQTAMAQIRLDQEKQSIEQQKLELDRQAKVTVTNQIAGRYNVPAGDLEGFTTPEQMEKYAAPVSQTNKVVRETTPQLNTSGDVPPDNIPSNDDDIIGRFGAGDPKITMDMYEGAMRRQNPNWNG